MSIVEEELGAPLSDTFDWFEYEPIAAASLGNLNLLWMLCDGKILQCQMNLASMFLICSIYSKIVSWLLQ